MFEHRPLDRRGSEIVRDDSGPRRVYHTPGGTFESVTTRIGSYYDKSWLEVWRTRVGANEADRVLRIAGTRGTAVHAMLEAYVANDPNYATGAMPVNRATFETVRPFLDRHVGVVRGQELPLWSATLRTAGTADLVADWDGVSSVIDYKTSRSLKDKSSITGYFVQGTAYALMVEEMYGLRVPRVVVLIASDDGETRAFVERARVWYDETARVFCGEKT